MTATGTLAISTFEPAYQQQVIDLILHIQQHEFNVPVTIADQPDLLSIKEVYCHGNGNFWVATLDGQLIGTIALIDFGQHRGALRKMFVDASYRGKQWRIGQQLLDLVAAWCKEKDIREIFLGTFHKLMAAQRFYLKNNFEWVEKDALPEQFPLMAVDNRFFKLDVQQYD